ncbi:NF038129 family PEP-CTERM protein [Massilia sp. Se16.2.3]|uniref:NF038129 family PEP-CTERM protein n=1 Tax=Massilia sp. Se16.2.3 TaxID=2709303 RepID=UPI0015FED343|nr:NF038129 family PEP-CTERM protein [Massilia sp. Se16.2.3]QNA99333.1 PEP-CTERM sorting domain-containing protein [Massilia sp. Se16.2.3]
MFKLKNLFTRALLALMLATGAGAALAGPTYHVTVDTRGYEGSGTLDFLFLGYDTSAPGNAFLSNFTGDYGSDSAFEGDASGAIDSGVVLGTSDWYNSFAQSVNLGGRFGFDLRFDVGPAGGPLGFSVGLFSDALGQYLGADATPVSFELSPGQPDLIALDASLVRVAEVPEPAGMAQLALGLALMAWTARQRRKR